MAAAGLLGPGGSLVPGPKVPRSQGPKDPGPGIGWSQASSSSSSSPLSMQSQPGWQPCPAWPGSPPRAGPLHVGQGLGGATGQVHAPPAPHGPKLATPHALWCPTPTCCPRPSGCHQPADGQGAGFPAGPRSTLRTRAGQLGSPVLQQGKAGQGVPWDSQAAAGLLGPGGSLVPGPKVPRS